MFYPDQPFRQNSTLYAGTNAGVFRSMDDGQSWQAANTGLPTGDISALVSNPLSGALYARTADGIFHSTDNGQNWQAISPRLPGRPGPALTVDQWSGSLYAATLKQLFRYSEAGGPSWQPVGGALLADILSLAPYKETRTLYVGTTGQGVFRSSVQASSGWGLAGGAPPSDNYITALVVDLRSGMLYAGTGGEGVFRLAHTDATAKWTPSRAGLTDLDIHTLALDKRDGALYVGTANGVFRSTNGGETWQAVIAGLTNLYILSLVFDSRSGVLYVGTQAGAFRSADRGASWQPTGEELAATSVYTLTLRSEPSRSDVASAALELLRATHPAERDNKAYPWQLALSPATGLPMFVRTWLEPPRQVKMDDVSPQIATLLTPTQLRAIFGLRDELQGEVLEQELVPGPVIQPSPQLQICHFTWNQVYSHNGQVYPVIGGSVRIHGQVGDERIAVTNSYFPIPADYTFSDGSSPAEDFGAAYLRPNELDRPALQAVIQAAQADQQPFSPFLAALVEQNLARQDTGDLKQLLPLVEADLPGWRRWPISGVRWLLNRPALASSGLRLLPLAQRLAGIDKQAVRVEVVPIHNHAYNGHSSAELRAAEDKQLAATQAILPFNGAYYLVQRVRVQKELDDIPWYMYVDTQTGQVLGEPWQPILRALYYQTSGETASGITSDTSTASLDVADLQTYVTGLSLNGPPPPSLEAATVAVHAQRLYRHLDQTCQVDLNIFRPNQTPGLKVVLNYGGAQMGFVYAEELQPKEIRFWDSDPVGIDVESGAKKVYAPALDPEVILHEFTHGFLWLLNSQPWDMPNTITPFGRALQEGYAMYLSRSVAARTAGEMDEFWARAAYPEKKRNTNPPESNWEDRWRFAGRNKKIPGADLLPFNTYLAGSNSNLAATETEKLFNLFYDVGMAWARTLWDLSEILGLDQADWLAVQACPYLHGAVANFEVAVQGLQDADRFQAADTDPINLECARSLWTERGIAIGYGVHGFAQATNGVLIAAGDEGVLRYNSGNDHWELDNILAAGTLTGVVAVEADGNTFYAAVQLPPSTTTGNNTQWKPGIFKKEAGSGIGSAWQPVGDWSLDTNDATPFSLLAPGNGSVLVGTHKGVYTGQADPTSGSWQWRAPTSSTASQEFSALSLALQQYADPPGPDLKAVLAHSLEDFYQEYLPPPSPPLPAEDWINLGIPFKVRLTTITSYGGANLVAGALDGLWHITQGGAISASQIGNITQPILALAANNTHFYYATPEGVFRRNDLTTNSNPPAEPLGPGLPGDASVISLYVTTDNTGLVIVLAGTLVHGIWRWRYDDLAQTTGQWQQQYSPSLPNLVILTPGERGVLSFSAQPANPPLPYQANLLANNISLLKVVQLGFPLQTIWNNSTPLSSLALSPGPVILLLERAAVGAAGGTATFTVEVSNATNSITIQ